MNNVNTQELIAAVREPPLLIPWTDESWTEPAVRKSDYDALRAAVLAVLDEIASRDHTDYCWDDNCKCGIDSARALRERIKP